MRKLSFIVNNESIQKDPSCNFSGLFPGKNPDIEAEFSFSDEWNNTVKVVAFFSMLDAEYEPQVLVDNSCKIPKEALSRAAFKIQVIGKKTRTSFGKDKLKTDKLTIRQTGGKR